MADEIFELKGKVSIDTSDLDKISKSFKGAVSSITKSTSQIKSPFEKHGTGFETLTEGVKTADKALEELHETIDEMGKSVMKNFDSSDYAKKLEMMERLKSNYEDLMATAKKEDAFLRPNKGNAKEDVEYAFGGGNDYLKAYTDELAQMKKAISSIGGAFKDSAKKIKIFGNQLKRIMVYRAIRGLLKGISSALKEGITNLYNFSKLTNTGEFAKSMDSLKTNFTYIKNSIATVLAPIIQAITPLFERLADSVASACDTMARFIAILTNNKQYYSAIKAMKEYIKTQRQLLGFDELNVLNGSDEDSTYDFNYVDVGELSQFELKIQELALDIGEIIPKGIDNNLIGLALVGAILGSTKLFSLGGDLAGLSAIFSAIAMTLGISKILPEGIDPVTVGQILAGALLITNTMFSFKGTLGGLEATLFNIGLAIVINDISSIISDKLTVDSSEFWERLQELFAKGAIISGLAIGLAFGGVAGVVALSVGAVLSIICGAIKYGIEKNPEVTTDGEIGALSEIGTAKVAIKGASKKISVAVQARADGGAVSTGSLFVAGESGAELVSNLGGRTQVFNDTQLMGELSIANEGVINAVLQAANAIVSSVNSIPTPSIKIGDREIYNASQRGSRIVGGSLVTGA